MLSNLQETSRERFYLALVLCIGLLRFINLGFLDMQAWDEALYVVRAEGILRFGGWIDQTPFAIDGLYSALHPPVHIWLTALTFNVIGISEFSARFISAVAGLFTLLFIYRIGKRLANSEVGLLAAILFGLNPFVSFYARQGQFDSTLTFFLTTAAYFLIAPKTRTAARQAVIAGALIGAALMTKLYVGLGLPVAYASYILFSKDDEKKRQWKNLLIASSIAIVIAAPWHMYMTIIHGDGDPLFFFNASAFWERSVSGIEGNVKPLEVFYFINQLFVLFPIGVLWFCYGLWSDLQKRQEQWLLLATWFLVFFVVFSLMRTKLAVYLLPMLVPASLLAAREIWNTMQDELKPKKFVILSAGTLLAVLWAASQSWRNEVKELLLLRIDSDGILSLLPFILLTILILAISVALYKRPVLTTPLKRLLIHLILLPSFVLSLYYVMYFDTTEYIDGGKDLAAFVQEQGIDRIIVAGYERNPQLTYYLNGIDIGWRDDIRFRRIIPPKDTATYSAWLLSETVNEPSTALLVLEKDKFIRYEVINPMTFIPPDYELVLSTRRYACFQRIKITHFAMGKE